MDEQERGQLTSDFRSGDPGRVAAALRALDLAWQQGRFGPLPMPTPDCMDAFGGVVPPEVLSKYLTVVRRYSDFDPTPSDRERHWALVEAAIRYGDYAATFEVARALGAACSPEQATAEALQCLQSLESEGPREWLVRIFVEHILDSFATRRAALKELKIWVMADFYPGVTAAIARRLDDAERRELYSDEGGSP